MKKPNIQQRKCSACHPLATDTLPLINSFVDHTVFYIGADSCQTPLQFFDILYRSLVNAILNQPLYFLVDWTQVWCTRVDGRNTQSLFKIAKITLFCHRNRNLSFTSYVETLFRGSGNAYIGFMTNLFRTTNAKFWQK